MSAKKIKNSQKDKIHPETALKAFISSPEFYRLLADSITDVIWVLNVNQLGIVYISPAVEHLLGYLPSEVVDQSLISFMPQESLDFVKAAVEEEREDLQNETMLPRLLEMKLLHKDGRIVWAEVSFRYIRDKNERVIGMVGVARDATARLDAIEARRVSEGRYRTILDEIEEGYCESDLAGNVVFMNQAGCDSLGYKEEELLSMNYKDVYNPEDQDRVFQAFHRVYETGEPYKDLVGEIFKKDGTPRQHELSVILIRDKDGNPIGFRGIGRDITARKQEELKLKEAYADLDRRVIERTAELARINKVLEAKTSSLSEANTALRVLLEKKDETRKSMEERMVFNVMEAISPMIVKLKGGRLPEREKVYIELIEEQLNKITSPFSQSLSMQFRKLTPTEIQIANLIKHGKKNKEIAELTCLAQSTIESHRKNIRKKFKIDNQKINLRTYLLSLEK